MQRRPDSLHDALMLRQVGPDYSKDFLHTLVYTKPFCFDKATSVENMRKMLLSLSLQPQGFSWTKFKTLFNAFALFNSEYDRYLDTAEKFRVEAVLRDNFENWSPRELFFNIIQKLGHRDLIFNSHRPKQPNFIDVVGVDTENFHLVKYLEDIHMPAAVEYVKKGREVLGLALDGRLEDLCLVENPPLEVRDTEGNTPLLLLLRNMVELEDNVVEANVLRLLNRGALVNVYNYVGLTPALLAIDSPTILRILLKKGALVNVYSGHTAASIGLDGDSLLFNCIRTENEESLCLALDFGANPALPCDTYANALEFSREVGNASIVNLVRRAMTRPGVSAPSMLQALQRGRVAEVEALLQQGIGANQGVYVKKGIIVAPIDLAIQSGDESLARYLLGQGGSELFPEGGHKRSRLTEAVQHGGLGLVRLLVECGEPVHRDADSLGDTPLQAARKLQDPAIYNYLSRRQEKAFASWGNSVEIADRSWADVMDELDREQSS